MRADFLEPNSGKTGAFGHKAKIKNVAAAYTVSSADDSGVLFCVNQASAYTITMPNATDCGPGWQCTFMITTAAANAVIVAASSGDGDNVHAVGTGGDGGGAGMVTEGTAADDVTFISGATVGDKATYVCDGTSWFVHGIAADVAHITIG